MTFKEKLEKEHPEKYIQHRVSSAGCPSDYGYETEQSFGLHCKTMSCRACWDREIPGSDIEDGATEEMKQQIIEESIVTQKPDGNLEFRVERKILDSGNRRQFESGAVRDIQEGKGRCDLLPLDVVAEYFTRDGYPNEVLWSIYKFQESGDTTHLSRAVDSFNEDHWKNNRTMILEVSKHFEEGAKKYGENNWQKGIPVHCYIDSAVRHYLKFLRGDKDEPHDRAVVWNLMCAIWTCKHKPELNEYGKEC